MRRLKIKQVCDKVAMSRATIYRLIKEGQFPAQQKVNKKIKTSSSFWYEHEIDEWLKKQREVS